MSRQVLALCGGVGGAKLALGLSHILAADQLTIAVNTGDDFEHLGLHISPDIDTVLYTLAGIANADQGWGLEGESWQCMQSLEQLGGETWFRLGDKDLATHLQRSDLLRQGQSLTQVTQQLANQLGVTHTILPMSDQRVSTVVHTEQGPLAFQDYFVRQQCQPCASHFQFDGLEHANLNPRLAEALQQQQFDCVIICPSNPFVSIDPILSLPGLRQWLRDSQCPVLAVSPIVNGQAIKGPAAKMLAELGHAVSPLTVAQHYQDFLNGYIIDSADQTLIPTIEALGIACHSCKTWMQTLQDRIDLANDCLMLANQLEN